MTITLPIAENQHRPLKRILVKPSWSATNWTVLPMLSHSQYGTNINGFFVESFRRRTLPEIGDAWIRFQFGIIDGVKWDIDDTGDPDLRTDLTGYEVRIQFAPPPTDQQTMIGDGFSSDGSFDAQWRTVWWGTVEYPVDTVYPASGYLIGMRRYYCLDGFARKKRRMMNQHGAYVDGTAYERCEGHPGYNVSRSDGIVQGNKEPTLSSYQAWPTESGIPGVTNHTYPGAGTTWSDAEVYEHADLSTRSLGDPVFELREPIVPGAVSLLYGTTAWTVDVGMPAWDFIAKILRRQRGRGVAFVDWEDDSDDPTGDLDVCMRLMPQTLDDVSYTPPGGSATTIAGATSAETTVDVDLEGDHRNIEPRFQIGTRHQHKVDYLESVGEFLQVLVTLGYYDGSLVKRWTDDEADDFIALAADKRLESRWDVVFQVHRLKTNWQGTAKDGNNNVTVNMGTYRVDYRCDDDGAVVVKTTSDPVDTSPLVVEFLKTLPLYEAYDYAGSTIERYDGTTETTEPERRKPLLLLRNASNRYQDGKIEVQLSLCMSETEIEVSYPPDEGTRLIGDTSEANLESEYDLDDLAITIGLQLPHRVRFASGDPNGERKLRIYHKDHHLWLASAGAIWSLDNSTANTDGSVGRRNCLGATPAAPSVLRDDRAGLLHKHALAWTWYGDERRTATWSLKGCGFLPSFTVDGGGTGTYPQMGQLTKTLQAGGKPWTLNTPITGMDYDAVEDISVWITDWNDLDYVEGEL